MNILMPPRLIGLIAGLLIGMLFVLVGWRIVLILLAFAIVGYIVGSCLESDSALGLALRRLYIRLFRP